MVLIVPVPCHCVLEQACGSDCPVPCHCVLEQACGSDCTSSLSLF